MMFDNKKDHSGNLIRLTELLNGDFMLTSFIVAVVQWATITTAIQEQQQTISVSDKLANGQQVALKQANISDNYKLSLY